MLRNLEVFVKRKLRQYFKKKYAARDEVKLENENFAIVSNNCWGGSNYLWLNKPYNTPFIGLFIYGPCYIKLLQNFEYYMNHQLLFADVSKYKDREKTYPVGLLGDVEVHFTHYMDTTEALLKWERRKSRMEELYGTDNLFFTICDRERVDTQIIKEFHKLPFKNKLSFGALPIEGLNDLEHIKVYERPKSKNAIVPNGRKLFKISFLYIDLVYWFNSGKIKRTRFKY